MAMSNLRTNILESVPSGLGMFGFFAIFIWLSFMLFTRSLHVRLPILILFRGCCGCCRYLRYGFYPTEYSSS